MTDARARDHRPQQALRRPAGDQECLAQGHARRAPADHRPERRRQDHAVQPGHRRPHRRRRLGQAVRPGAARHAHARPRASRARPHLSDPHAVPARNAAAQRGAGAARPRQAALESLGGADRPPASVRRRRARRWRRSGSTAAPTASSPRPPMASGGGWNSRWRWRRSRRCCCSTSRSPACRKASGRPCATCSTKFPRDVTIVMIEHDMDTALGFAERITLLHYGEVIVEGTRAEVVADPRTREVYLGD